LAVACLSCGGRSLVSVLSRNGLPKSGQFLATQGASHASLDLRWDACRDCGLMWIDPECVREVDYTHVTRSTTNQMPGYKDDLVRRIVGACADRRASVVEVGANDGGFLRIVKEAGLENLTGIEPSAAFRSRYEGTGIGLIQCHLSAETVDRIRSEIGPASVVVCRHTLEHIPEPGAFLQALRCLLRDERSLLIVEVPNSASLVRHVAVHELWDEHLFYFSEQNARALLAHNGFRAFESRIYPHLGSENLVIYARPVSAAARGSAVSTEPGFDIRTLGARIEQLSTDIKRQAAAWKKPVAALGASHPQTNYLSITGVAQFVDCLVDDDRNKHGKYVPVAGRQALPVVSTEETHIQLDPRTILLTAFGYPEWIARVQKRFTGRDVRFVDPYAAITAGGR
jgi:2-polyprenyl-3-methyl-5-hydroxy-6-metoxy-1,4-benzoquinol methylase